MVVVIVRENRHVARFLTDYTVHSTVRCTVFVCGSVCVCVSSESALSVLAFAPRTPPGTARASPSRLIKFFYLYRLCALRCFLLFCFAVVLHL